MQNASLTALSVWTATTRLSVIPHRYDKMVKLANPKTATSMDYLDGGDNTAELDESGIYPLAAPSDHFDRSGRVASPVTVDPNGRWSSCSARDAVAKQVAATIDELRKHELTEGTSVACSILYYTDVPTLSLSARHTGAAQLNPTSSCLGAAFDSPPPPLRPPVRHRRLDRSLFCSI